MATRQSGAVETGVTVATVVVLGLVSGITVVAAPPALTAVVVLASDVAGTFYAGVLLGTFLGLFLAGFTAFLTYRVYRLQQLTTPDASDGVGSTYAPTTGPNVTYRTVNGGEPPWFDAYLVGVVTALVAAALAPTVVAPLAGGVVGALASARLFAAF
jgi:glycerol uptake facilitator-like aquaporin